MLWLHRPWSSSIQIITYCLNRNIIWSRSHCVWCHDDVIKWKYFPRYWPFVRGIHRSPVNFSHKGQWRGALMFPLICVWINGWVNNREAGYLRRHRAHYDVTVMYKCNIYLASIRIDCHAAFTFVNYIYSSWFAYGYRVCHKISDHSKFSHNQQRNANDFYSHVDLAVWHTS